MLAQLGQARREVWLSTPDPTEKACMYRTTRDGRAFCHPKQRLAPNERRASRNRSMQLTERTRQHALLVRPQEEERHERGKGEA
jgi:hypothetical protein